MTFEQESARVFGVDSFGNKSVKKTEAVPSNP
jgi:hypothetical protein